MSATPFADLSALATHLRQELQTKKFILLYAYNGTGKTRLSTAFKDLGKNGDERDTLYFNAFTEDLFSWDNDLKNDRERVLTINKDSRFFAGLKELEMDNRIRPLLNRYADFDFRIDTDEWEVSFSREVQNGDKLETVDDIKISRGEENIFIWCFFLAIVQLALDGAKAYEWVKYIYIDDPISSLDEHNAIAVGHHLAQFIGRKDHSIKFVLSSHHSLFFNVLWNELREIDKKGFAPHFLARSKKTGEFTLVYTGDTPFFHHLALLQEICEARNADELCTHHFNALRGLLEKASTFHGHQKFSVCIKKTEDDPDETLFGRTLNILSHGNYSYYEPTKMLPETKETFEKVFDDFLDFYPFNKALLSEAPAAVAAPAATPVAASAKTES
ncbi:MAG: anticodon nuclease [Verrucomicrobia bacterium]|nr:MAG: anticodon nuclease [Verrucomicrobiota bacterium]